MPTLNNWNHEIQFQVDDDHFKKPMNVSELQAIVTHASEKGQRVTVIGAMHSTSECMVGSEMVISMEKMDGLVSIDQDQLTATVQGGMTLRQMCAHLKAVSLRPPVVLEWGNFQIGAISGTHANDTSTRRSSQFSSFVLSVKLVTPDGKIMEISESQNTEYLPAVRSHNGMLGVVYEVTVRVFKTQPLHVDFQVAHIDTFLSNFAANLETLKSNFDQVFGMLFPTTGKLLWQRRSFLDREANPQRPASPGALLDPVESKAINLFGDLFLPLVKAVTTLRPSAPLAGLISSSMIELPLKLIRHSSYIIDPCDRAILWDFDDPDFEFYDWVFPEEQWAAMVRAFLQLSNRYQQEHNFILPLPALIYFIPQDQASLLSRSRNSNMLAIDPEFPDPKDPTWKAFRLDFNKIALLHGGIPHINKTREGAIKHLADVQDPECIQRFLQIRKQLDPKAIFLNDHFKAMFAKYL